MKPKYTTLFPIICVLTLAIFVGCQSKDHGHEENHHNEAGHESEVHLSEEAIKSLNLQLAPVTKEVLYEEIQVTGKVVQDTENMTYVFSPNAGIVETIYVLVGQWVDKGKPLIKINGETIPSPRNGTVLTVNTAKGANVSSMESLFAIAQIDPIRVVLDVYPKDMDHISIGQKVKVYLIGHANEVFWGQIKYISPRIDEQSQTLKVNAMVKNKGQHLKFGMFVQGKILAKAKGETLVVPEEAVLRFGQEYAVFLPADEENAFEKREIRIGERGIGNIEILEGLKEGDQVVTQGNFILKSESLKSTMGEGHAH